MPPDPLIAPPVPTFPPLKSQLNMPPANFCRDADSAAAGSAMAFSDAQTFDAALPKLSEDAGRPPEPRLKPKLGPAGPWK